MSRIMNYTTRGGDTYIWLRSCEWEVNRNLGIGAGRMEAEDWFIGQDVTKDER